MSQEKKQPRKENDDCVIPTVASPEALNKYSLKESPLVESHEIREYVESESRGEHVTYLERIVTERVGLTEYDTWDVHTDGERYWVITNPTNLYSQRLFPSADFTLSLHVGLMMRVASRRSNAVDAEHAERLAASWRRWTQAAEALDRAHEAEEFQAIGMRCRETMLTLVREMSDENMVPPGEEAPKLGDFIHWAEHISNALASGRGNREIRGYLKELARQVWQLSAWLTHERGSSRLDAEMVVDATHAVLRAFGLARFRFEHGAPTTCPLCASYKIRWHYVGDITESMSYAPLCDHCGWSKVQPDQPGLVDETELKKEAPGS